MTILKKALLNRLKKRGEFNMSMNWLTGLRSVSVLTLPIHFHSLWCSSAAWMANGVL